MDETSSSKKIDRRITRSLNSLRDALLALLKEKPYDKVSVTDLSNQAGVARITFYQHFESKDDLLLKAVSDFFTGLLDAFDRDLFLEFVRSGELQAVEKLVQARSFSGDELLLMRTAVGAIRPQLCDLMIAEFMRFGGDESLERQLVVTYHIGGVLSLLERSFSENQPLSVNEEIVPLVFLRALRLEALESGLLGKVLGAL